LTWSVKRRVFISLFALMFVLGVPGPLATNAQNEPAQKAQDEAPRKIKSRIQPVYPELARKLKLSGVAKVMVTISPDGKVKDAKIVGGHPVFTEAALNAVKKWKYEPARDATTDLIEIRFSPPEQ
jgi:TonB family protein